MKKKKRGSNSKVCEERALQINTRWREGGGGARMSAYTHTHTKGVCAGLLVCTHSAGRKTGSSAVGSRNSGADQSPGGWHYGRSAIVYSPATSSYWQSEVSMWARECVCRNRLWDGKSLKIRRWKDRVCERKDTRLVSRCVCVCVCEPSTWQVNMGLSSVRFGSGILQVNTHSQSYMEYCTHTHSHTLGQADRKKKRKKKNWEHKHSNPKSLITKLHI